MPESFDVVVVGAGSSGASIAWQLAARGAGSIALLDKAGVAAGGTGRSSALIRQHYTHPALAVMALRSLRIFQHFQAMVGATAEFHQTGFLVLVAPADAAALQANVDMQTSVGVQTRVLKLQEVQEIEPRIFLDDVGAAAWEPESGYADPVAATHAYVQAAENLGVIRKLGVEAQSIVSGPSGARGVMTNRGFFVADTVVVAAGFRTQELLAPLGWRLNMRPVRHSIAIVERTGSFGKPHPIVSDRINGSYYRPEGSGLTLIGTTAPYEGHDDPDVEADKSPDDGEIATLAGRFTRRFPTETNARFRRGYTGVYDCSPDLQPILGPVPDVPGLHIACGFSGHGFKLSPVIGEMVAGTVLGDPPDWVDMDLFSIDRFTEGRPITSANSYSVATLG